MSRMVYVVIEKNSPRKWDNWARTEYTLRTYLAASRKLLEKENEAILCRGRCNANVRKSSFTLSDRWTNPFSTLAAAAVTLGEHREGLNGVLRCVCWRPYKNYPKNLASVSSEFGFPQNLPREYPHVISRNAARLWQTRGRIFVFKKIPVSLCYLDVSPETTTWTDPTAYGNNSAIAF